MELNEQEAHCVARLLQGLLYGEDYTDGCQYCKYQCGRRLPKCIGRGVPDFGLMRRRTDFFRVVGTFARQKNPAAQTG